MDSSLILILAGIFELLLILIFVASFLRVYRQFRFQRHEGRYILDAWEEALAVIMPARAARLIMLEPRLYFALICPIKKAAPACTEGCFYTRLDSHRLLVMVICGLCGLEILLVALLLPQEMQMWKLLHTGLGLWAILWLMGYYKAMRIYPHQVLERGIVFRLGVHVHQEINWKDICGISRVACSPPGYAPQPSRSEPEAMFLAAGDKCNVCVELAAKHDLPGFFRPIIGIQRFYLSLEKPDEFIEYALNQVPTAGIST